MNLKIKLLFVCLILIGSAVKASQGNVFDVPVSKVLLIKWNPDVSEESKRRIICLFKSLSNEVSGFTHFETRNIKSDRFEIAFFLQFSSLTALNTYRTHALHSEIMELGPALIEDYLEFEY